jgi:hypothetical protein
MNRPRLPTSLLRIEWLAPLLIVAMALLGVAQGAAKDPDGSGIAALFALLCGLPTLGAALAAGLLARRRQRDAVVALAVALALQVGVALLIEGGGRWRDVAIVIALACSCLTFLVASPVLVATAVLASRPHEAAGDTLLGIGGAWLVVVELGLGAYQAVSPRGVAFGIAAGVALVGVALWRARARRTFCRRVALGQVAGLRMRYPIASDALASLPVLFGPEADAVSIVEEQSPAGDVYRATTLGVPIARAPSAYAALASEGSRA